MSSFGGALDAGVSAVGTGTFSSVPGRGSTDGEGTPADRLALVDSEGDLSATEGLGSTDGFLDGSGALFVDGAVDVTLGLVGAGATLGLVGSAVLDSCFCSSGAFFSRLAWAPSTSVASASSSKEWLGVVR